MISGSEHCCRVSRERSPCFPSQGLVLWPFTTKSIMVYKGKKSLRQPALLQCCSILIKHSTLRQQVL